MNINMQELVVHQYSEKPKARVDLLPLFVIGAGLVVLITVALPF